MKRFTRDDSLWVKLQKETRPIFLYGTGNGADKILDVCEMFSIPVEGVFASSDFVRSRTFRGMPVQSIDMICEKYGADIVVLLAFGTTLSSVAENIKAIAKNHTLFIPEVPLYGKELFTYEYYLENLEKIESVYELFADERSKQIYEDMIGFRLSGEPKLLANAEPVALSYAELFTNKDVFYVVDCGAYKGDSTKMMVDTLRPWNIVAIEPDPKTFLKLSAYAENESRSTVTCVNAAVGKEDTTAFFMASASRGSGKEGLSKSAKMQSVAVRSVDSILEGEVIDLLKLDVEGDEMEALLGARETIRCSLPNLAVSVYHRTGDIFELTLKVKEMLPDFQLYLRREECIPAWDITLFAVRN